MIVDSVTMVPHVSSSLFFSHKEWQEQSRSFFRFDFLDVFDLCPEVESFYAATTASALFSASSGDRRTKYRGVRTVGANAWWMLVTDDDFCRQK